MANVPTKVLKVAGSFGSYGEDGATFVPSVSANGDLSWTNDKGFQNPKTVNIKGAKGDTGVSVTSQETLYYLSVDPEYLDGGTHS